MHRPRIDDCFALEGPRRVLRMAVSQMRQILPVLHLELRGDFAHLVVVRNRRHLLHPHPTDPSISKSMSRFSSTEYSIGNCRTKSFTNPFTDKLIACASLRPRCCM